MRCRNGQPGSRREPSAGFHRYPALRSHVDRPGSAIVSPSCNPTAHTAAARAAIHAEYVARRAGQRSSDRRQSVARRGCRCVRDARSRRPAPIAHDCSSYVVSAFRRTAMSITFVFRRCYGSWRARNGGDRKNSLPASLRPSPRFDAAILIRLRQRFTSCVARSGAVTVWACRRVAVVVSGKRISTRRAAARNCTGTAEASPIPLAFPGNLRGR